MVGIAVLRREEVQKFTSRPIDHLDHVHVIAASSVTWYTNSKPNILDVKRPLKSKLFNSTEIAKLFKHGSLEEHNYFYL